jgi:hypothetical protein
MCGRLALRAKSDEGSIDSDPLVLALRLLQGA